MDKDLVDSKNLDHVIGMLTHYHVVRRNARDFRAAYVHMLGSKYLLEGNLKEF